MKKLILLPLAMLTLAASAGLMHMPGFFGNRKSTSGPAATTIGLDTVASFVDTWGGDVALAMAAPCTNSGTLQSAYIYVGNTAIVDLKIAVYEDVDNSISISPGDTLVGVSSAIVSTGVSGWYSAPISGSVLSSKKYNLAVFLATTSYTLEVRTENASRVYYKNSAGFYASPPADGGAFGSSSLGTAGRISCYVTSN